ncbi:MAG TPA: serine/threonine-protein phosphatase [Thermofilum sp.]|nr:serine/threonine-protein phosphatase [Thermofilum sp.]
MLLAKKKLLSFYETEVAGEGGKALTIQANIAYNNHVIRGILVLAGEETHTQFVKVVTSFVKSLFSKALKKKGYLATLKKTKTLGSMAAVIGNVLYLDPGPSGIIKIGRKNIEVAETTRLTKKPTEITLITSGIKGKIFFASKKSRKNKIDSMHVATMKGKRKNNEDTAASLSLKLYNGTEGARRYIILAVADGAGGLKIGEKASLAAINGFIQRIIERILLQTYMKQTDVEEAVKHANTEVLNVVKTEGKQAATTLTAGLINGNRLLIAHVGDSRAYLIDRDVKKVFRLTKDHKISPQSHIITRALGIRKNLEVDLEEQVISPRSTVFICSDGVTDVINDNELGSIVVVDPLPATFSQKIFSMVKSRGAPDNATISAFSRNIEIG